MKKFLFWFVLPVLATAQVNISPNMGMPVPVPGVTPGPGWANNINASLSIIDGHDHSSGKGVAVKPNGININTDLPFNSHNATLLLSTRFDPQSATLTDSDEIGQLYVVGNELYYNDVSGGNQIQITSNGSVNAGAGSISGLPSGTASASYSGGTFVWRSATNTAANLDARSIILRNSTVSSNGLTLNPPAAMGSNISETLPTVPLATKIMQMDSSGNMSAVVDVDNSTIQWTSNTLAVKNQGITQTQLANNSVGTAQIIDANVTYPKLGIATTSSIQLSSGSFVVPAKVTMIWVKGSGGGGGGGGTSLPVGGTVTCGAAGGGGGAPVLEYSMIVTPGETLTVTIAAGGAGGTSGGQGSNGGTSSVVGSLESVYFPGGGGGGGFHYVDASSRPTNGRQSAFAIGGLADTTSTSSSAGAGGGAAGQGAAGVAPVGASNQDGNAGTSWGSGGTAASRGTGGGAGVSKGGAPSVITASTSSGGAQTSSAQPGGGGGGSSWGVGGDGGAGNSGTGNAGVSAAANTGAGGGGASAQLGANSSKNGGDGGSGKIIIYYVQGI